MTTGDRYWGCSCQDVPEEYHTVHAGVTDPSTTIEWDPECPKHGQGVVTPRAPFMVAAGVIRGQSIGPGGAVAVVTDVGHPRGPVVGKAVWFTPADRGRATDEAFRGIHRTIQEAGQ